MPETAMTTAHATPAGSPLTQAGSNPLKTSFWTPIVAFVLFSIAIAATGDAILQHFKGSIKRDKQSELAAIADLKTGQITNWLAERKGDAQAIANDPFFLIEVDGWLSHGGSSGQGKMKLMERLESLQRSYAEYGYTAISLFDENARLRLSTSKDEETIPGHDREQLLKSMRNGDIIVSDIHAEARHASPPVEIDVAAPLLIRKNGKQHLIGAILFHIDPDRFLFPLIQHWPTPSATAENLLVRRNGDEVVFLNKLRHSSNSGLSMHLPLEPELAAAAAVTGHEGVVDGVDYRGTPVIGVLNRISGTSWFLVSKADKEEIYAPIERLTKWVVGLMFSLIAVGGGIAVFWREK